MKRIIAISIIAVLSLSNTAALAQSETPDSQPGNPGNIGSAVEYNQLPDVLDCNQFSWMENCSALNRQAKRNPSAPIRARANDGTEYTFSPDTPKVVIAHMLNPTLATARAVVARERRLQARDEKAARLARQVIAEKDGQFGFDGFDGASGLRSVRDVQNDNARARRSSIGDITPGATIDPGKVRVFVFYDSHCGYCRKSIPEWEKLVAAHPDVDVRFLQLNRDPGFLSRMREVYGFKAVPLVGPKREQIVSRVKSTPTIWVQDQTSSLTKVVQGYRPMRRLEQIIADVSG